MLGIVNISHASCLHITSFSTVTPPLVAVCKLGQVGGEEWPHSMLLPSLTLRPHLAHTVDSSDILLSMLVLKKGSGVTSWSCAAIEAL